MGLPLKNKLSYLFGKVVNNGKLYGRVHSESTTETVYGRDVAMAILYDRYPAQPREVCVKTSHWLEATPLKDGAFKLAGCGREGNGSVFRYDIGEFDARQIVRAANQIEERWRHEGARLDSEQPFKDRLIADYVASPAAPKQEAAPKP